MSRLYFSGFYSVVNGFLCVSEMFSELRKVKTIFITIWKYFYCFFSWGVLMVEKELVREKRRELKLLPNYTVVVILFSLLHTQIKKEKAKKQVLPGNILIKQKNINYTTSLCLYMCLLKFSVMKWKVQIKCFWYVLKCEQCLEEKHMCNWVASWTSCFFCNGKSFSLERMTASQWLFRLGLFSQKNKVKLSLQGKQLTKIIANDKLDLLSES